MQKSDFVSITIIKLYFYGSINVVVFVCLPCFLLLLRKSLTNICLFVINFVSNKVIMTEHTIEIFMPLGATDDISLLTERLCKNASLSHLWLWSAGAYEGELPDNTTLLPVDSLTRTSVFKDMAERASADFVLYLAKPYTEIDFEALNALCETIPQNASMAYANYRKVVDEKVIDAPVIDCLEGALRNDFDFGPALLFRTSALKQYSAMQLDDYDYAGFYQLRLALGRLGEIYRFDGYLSREYESDNRKSGEKQFDYVNPAQRSVQVEMERVCTFHLKATGAWLPPLKYNGIDLAQGEFPVEASVVIPVLNRESTIADAIKSVLAQETSFEFNILVVDNHSTDRTPVIIDSFDDERVVHIIPESNALGIGGCWNLAVNDKRCGRFAVQLDSDDIYSSEHTLQKVVDGFYSQQCAMLVGTYRICDFELNTLPPGVIDHREWSEDNGRNNALRINGLGAPRAFYTPVIRKVGFPNVSYGEDYAVGLQISRSYRIGRIYDVLYLCRRWGGNSDAALSHEKVNANNLYKDTLRTAEFKARQEMMKAMEMPSQAGLDNFFDRQLDVWPEAKARFANLDNVRLRQLENGIMLQYNPSRAVSTGAKVDSESLKNRKCFLCGENRPPQQIVESALGCFDILVNPFPILPRHFTLAWKEHVPQVLEKMYSDMLLLAKEWQEMALFYNGAMCGASAPDHAHMQAVRRNDVPLLSEKWREIIDENIEPLFMRDGAGIYRAGGYVVPLFEVRADSVSKSVELLSRLLSAIPCHDGETEPRMNLISYYERGEGFVTIVIPRSKHRPDCYCTTMDNGRMVSPGTLDMAGLMVTPLEKDFLEMTSDEAMAIMNEVAIDDDMVAVIIENVVSCHEEC